MQLGGAESPEEARSLGYTGSVAVQIYKDLVAGEATRLAFFRSFTYALSAGAAGLILASAALILRSCRADRGDEKARLRRGRA